MTQSPFPAPLPDHSGSYDDLPEEPVHTVLSVPLAWTSSAAPVSSHQLLKPNRRARRRHARPSNQPPLNIRTPNGRTANDRAHRHTIDPRHSELRAEFVAAVRIGLLSAAVVLTAATLGLIAVAWLP